MREKSKDIIPQWVTESALKQRLTAAGVETTMSEENQIESFLRRVSMGGRIVSTACMDQLEIAVARDQGRILVLPDGCGFVWVPPDGVTKPAPGSEELKWDRDPTRAEIDEAVSSAMARKGVYSDAENASYRRGWADAMAHAVAVLSTNYRTPPKRR